MKFTKHEEKCQQSLNGLEEWINKLLDLADEILKSAKCSDNDHLGFMALCFLSRQVDHIQSVIRLVPNRDATLIARSMIEGLCQLCWAAQTPIELPLKWRTFGYVHDWRRQQIKINRGESITPDQQASNEIGLKKYGNLFYTKEARKAVSQNLPLPLDPYHRDWKCGMQIKQICDCVNAGDLYQEVYKSFSEWHHWDTAGIGEALSWNNNKVTFSSLSPSNSAMALAVGFQCLIQTIELTNNHLSLARELQIAIIGDGYIKWHQDSRVL